MKVLFSALLVIAVLVAIYKLKIQPTAPLTTQSTDSRAASQSTQLTEHELKVQAQRARVEKLSTELHQKEQKVHELDVQLDQIEKKNDALAAETDYRKLLQDQRELLQNIGQQIQVQTQLEAEARREGQLRRDQQRTVRDNSKAMKQQLQTLQRSALGAAQMSGGDHSYQVARKQLENQQRIESQSYQELLKQSQAQQKQDANIQKDRQKISDDYKIQRQKLDQLRLDYATELEKLKQLQ